MLNADMPAMTSSASAFTSYGMAEAGNLVALNQGSLMASGSLGQAQDWKEMIHAQARRYAETMPATIPTPASKQEIPMAATRRLVQVFIADPNENIPLDQSLIYSGDQKLTDATDQELFFEIDIKGLLEKHNVARIKVADKKVKERVEYLEAAKVRDLKMVVVTVAQF